MKNICIMLVFSVLAFVATAQTSAKNNQTTTDPVAREATDKLVAKYSLNADQAKTMYTIQARKLRNMKQIEAIKESDPARYSQKLASVQKGTLSSIKKLMRKKEQMDKFRSTQAQVANRKTEIKKQMAKSGSSKEAIAAAQMDVYEE